MLWNAGCVNETKWYVLYQRQRNWKAKTNAIAIVREKKWERHVLVFALDLHLEHVILWNLNSIFSIWSKVKTRKKLRFTLLGFLFVIYRFFFLHISDIFDEFRGNEKTTLNSYCLGVFISALKRTINMEIHVWHSMTSNKVK